MSHRMQEQMQSAIVQTGQKRKTLHDYFTPPGPVARKQPLFSPSPAEIQGNQSPTRPAQLSPTWLSPAPPRARAPSQSHGARPPGLSILHDFVTEAEETRLLTFLDAQQWRTDLSRRTIHYGGTYCLMAPRDATPAQRKAIENVVVTADAIPADLQFLTARMVERGLYASGSRPGYVIVNEYRPGQGISAHVENFRFASPVCGLTLSRGDWIRFHELRAPDDGSVRSGRAALAARTGARLDVWLDRRCLMVMDGESRHKWQHEIVGRKKGRDGGWRRVSLTFRTEKEKKTHTHVKSEARELV